MTSAAPTWRRYLRFRGADVRSDVDDELAFHIDVVAAAYVARGESPERAERLARQEFGDIDRAKAQCYRIGERRRKRRERGELFSALGQDMRYSLRALLASPAFTIGVVAMMALAIAANAAMFAVLDRLFIRAPAYLVAPGATNRVYTSARLLANVDGPSPSTSYRRYLDLRRFTHAFSHLAAISEREFVVADGSRSELARVARVSGSLWEMFDARPVLGRFPTEADDADNAPLIAVLGNEFWREHFAADTSVIGRAISVAGREYRVVGVAPRGFVGMSPLVPALFVPLEAVPPEFSRSQTLTTQYSSAWLEVIARRKPGWNVADATADLTSSLRRSVQEQDALHALPRTETPALAFASMRGTLGPVLSQQGPTRTDEARVALWLGGVAAIVLLIAALNVANLMLARTLRRQREIALRVALGATIGRLVRLLMAEAALLMTAGTVVGVSALWLFGETARQSLLPNVNLPRLSIDGRVVVFATASAIVATLIIALTPALHALGWNVASAINESGRSGGIRRSRARAAILITQAALSLALCVTAGLFVRSLYNVRALPLGYDPRNVLTLTPVAGAYGSWSAPDIAKDLMKRARSLDDAVNVAESMSLPFTSSMMRRIVADRADSAALQTSSVFYNGVSPSYFAAVSTRIVDGRAFDVSDSAGGAPVAIVSAPMAARMWPNAKAVGQCFTFDFAAAECVRVVGVAEGTRHWSYQRDAMLEYYVPIAQSHAPMISVIIRTKGEARLAAERVRRQLEPFMPLGTVLKVAPMQDALDKAAAPWRVGAMMLSVFAALALVVATLGVYATANYDLTEREHEIGIRLALGATSGDVFRATVVRGLLLALAGVIVGSVVSLAVGSILSTLLFGVSSRDPGTFFVAASAITLAFVAASGAPALRAARADPSLILRSG